MMAPRGPEGAVTVTFTHDGNFPDDPSVPTDRINLLELFPQDQFLSSYHSFGDIAARLGPAPSPFAPPPPRPPLGTGPALSPFAPPPSRTPPTDATTLDPWTPRHVSRSRSPVPKAIARRIIQPNPEPPQPVELIATVTFSPSSPPVGEAPP